MLRLPWLKMRWVLAAGTGLCWAAAFPRTSLGSLAWVVPALILTATGGDKGVPVFRLGYVAGGVHHLASLSWLLFIPFPTGAVAGWLALSAYLALYPAAWAWLAQRAWLWAAAEDTPGEKHADAAKALAGWWNTFSRVPWYRRVAWGLFCAAAWVAFEMAVARMFTGFPWNLLGVSQHRLIPLIQLASVTGVYGISFLVVWTSVSALMASARICARPGRPWAFLADVTFPALAVVGIMAWGTFRSVAPAPSRTLKAALIQPSIPQLLIWDRSQDAGRLAEVIRLSELALTTGPDLLIWPESAIPPLTEEHYRTITNLVARHGVWMVFGADDAVRRTDDPAGKEYDFYNAAFLIDPSGSYAAHYRKQHLVIFGEYVPLERWLPFIKHFTPIQGSFTPGAGPVTFVMDDPPVRFSVLICFEDVLAGLTRRAVTPDTDFLLNITNDGWFGQSAAQWQQAANAAFRAVENGLPLVRSTNNGLTCWIDPQGNIRDIFGEATGDVYAAGFTTVEIPLRPLGQPLPRTFYHRFGDWFGWSCVAVVAAAGATAWIQRRRASGVEH